LKHNHEFIFTNTYLINLLQFQLNLVW